MIDRSGQQPHGLLRGVESHRVFGLDEVEEKLRLALGLAGTGERRIRNPGIARGFRVGNELDERSLRASAYGI